MQRGADRHERAVGLLTDGGGRGAGVISTTAGVAALLALLLFAAQLLLHLYATSVLTAATYDAARTVARGDTTPPARHAAEARARRLLGRFGDDVTFTWLRVDDEIVALHAEVAGTSFFGAIDRTIHVRRECLRTDDSATCAP